LIIAVPTLLAITLIIASAVVADGDKVAQLISAITSVFSTSVIALGYYLMIRTNGEMLKEQRQQRLSGGRPQVIIEARYDSLPLVNLVVRNISGGVAKDIKFDFSAPLEDSSGFVVSDLPYFKGGINFLGPGEEVACSWDHLEPLIETLRKKELHKGIVVMVRYKDLAGETYETDWAVNPLLYEGSRNPLQDDEGAVVRPDLGAKGP
jgi:hypothetical protein